MVDLIECRWEIITLLIITALTQYVPPTGVFIFLCTIYLLDCLALPNMRFANYYNNDYNWYRRHQNERRVLIYGFWVPIIAAYVEIDPTFAQKPFYIFISGIIHCAVSFCIDYLLYAFVDRMIFTWLYGIHWKYFNYYAGINAPPSVYFNNRHITTCQLCYNPLQNRNQSSVILRCGDRFHVDCLQDREIMTFNNGYLQMECRVCHQIYKYNDKWYYYNPVWDHNLSKDFDSQTLMKFMSDDVRRHILKPYTHVS